MCKLHPKYKGKRKPTSKKKGCTCQKLYPAKVLRDAKTGQPIMLPHGNTKYSTAFSKGTGFHGKTFSELREMGRKASENLIKALNDPEAIAQTHFGRNT